MIAGAAKCVRFLEKLAQRILPLGGAPQDQEHALDGKGIKNGTLIVAKLGERVNVSLQGDTNPLIDRSGDARAGVVLRQDKAAGERRN